MSDASRTYGTSRNALRMTAEASKAAFELFQQRDGRAAILARDGGASAGETIKPSSSEVYTVTKAAVVLLDGCEAFWDRSARALTYAPGNDRDFFAGTIVGDAASGDGTATLNLNQKPEYELELRKGYWQTEATDGLGVTQLFGGGAKLAFDAVAEVAQAAIYSSESRSVDANGIYDFLVSIADGGDNAALDIDFGFASASHATDFEAIPIFAAFHLDGNSLLVYAHSDDGTTDTGAVTTGVTLTLNTPARFTIDVRDKASVKFYINGARVASGTTFNMAAATGEVKPIALIEKTSDDTTADVRLLDAKLRTGEQ